MRCPSTSDLVHAQANHAYDKLAVISDNIEALQAIYDFIFDIKEYLHQRLKEYMHKHRDELIDGQKTFIKPIRLEELELFSSVNADIEDTVGNIKLNFTTCSPYISFKVSRIDDETKEEYVSEVKLILDVCNGKPLLTIPPTNGDEPESSVRVDYLEEQLDIIRTRIASLEDRVSIAEHDIDNLEDRATQVEGRVSQVETRIDNWPPDKDTTYSISLENGRLVIRANDGTTQTVDLSSISGNVGTQVGHAFRVGMIRSCFCIYGGNILPGDLINGSWLIYGTHKFQVEDDDKQWSECSYFGEHRSFCTLRQAISNGWTLPSNTTWVALAPCHGQDYADTHGLFMCVEVR